MSANICYEKVDKKPPCLQHASCPGAFMDTMSKVFGEFPFILVNMDVPVLQGMAAASDDAKVFEEVIEIIQKMGPIKLYVVW